MTTRQLVCSTNQLTDFCIMRTLTLNELKELRTLSGSKDCRKQQAFQNAPLLCARRRKGRGILSRAGQSISNTVKQKRGKKYLLTYPISAYPSFCPRFYWIHPLVTPLFPQNILVLPKGGRLNYFLKNWTKLTNDPAIFSGYYKIIIFLLLRSQNNWKPYSGNNVTKGNRFERPKNQINVEQECNFRKEKSKGSVSESWKNWTKLYLMHSSRWKVCLCWKKCYSQGTLFARLIQKTHILRFHSQKLPKIGQVPIERPAMQMFLSILWTFFRTKSFHHINESSNIFVVETMHKNYNISRWYALDGSFLRRTANCSGFIDISAS